MKLLSNHLHVERVKQTQASYGGRITLPQIALDDINTGGPKEYRVLAVGPGRTNKKSVNFPIECEPGDKVICHSYTTGSTELPDGTFIITDDQIIAVIPLQK